MIRKMILQDIDAVLHIWLEGNLQAHPYIPRQYWLEQWVPMRQLYLPQATVWVFEEEKEKIVKAFIGIVENSFIAGLFVLPDFQGQGIGRALLAYCQNQYENLTLQVYCKNKKAISFYEKNNFQILAKQQEEENREDEFVMHWEKDT